MARKPKYDPGVTVFVDRHGKQRARYRLRGISCYIPHPSSPEYKKVYQDLTKGIVPRRSRVKPRSIGDLCERFYASTTFQRGSEGWQRTMKQVLEPFREEAKDLPVRGFTFEHIERAIIRRAHQQVAGGKKVGGGFAAKRFHEMLIRLFAYAEKLEWITSNPAAKADGLKWETKGFHTWTEEEIATFQERHPIGTKARLAMEIALWTGLRRGDVARLGHEHIKGGRVVMKAAKTGKDLNVLLSGDLREVLENTPLGKVTFLETEFGKPFSTAGLGNWFRERCDEAGLHGCTIHGLRKAAARRLAEGGATQPELKAFGGWSGDSEVATYIRNADAKRLADSGLRKAIKRRTSSNRPKRLDKKRGPTEGNA